MPPFATSYPDLRWYQVELHTEQLAQWMEEMATTLPQIYHCVDVFGASGRIVDTWMDAGWNAIGFDIKIHHSHDLCSEGGVKTLLKMGLQLLDCTNFGFGFNGICMERLWKQTTKLHVDDFHWFSFFFTVQSSPKLWSAVQSYDLCKINLRFR